MKIKAIITIALIISAVLMAGRVSPGINTDQFREGKYIHLDSMEIAFNKTDADVSIEYHLNPFAQTYIFLFGSKNLEPKIKEIFSDFGNVEIQKIGRNSASIQVKNVSKKSENTTCMIPGNSGCSRIPLPLFTLRAPEEILKMQNPLRTHFMCEGRLCQKSGI